jgi:hypothetical protein
MAAAGCISDLADSGEQDRSAAGFEHPPRRLSDQETSNK